MFWRFTANRDNSSIRQVLLVNSAEVVGSVCDSCDDDLVSNPSGESILVAGPGVLDNQTYHYCIKCGYELWVPTLSGRKLKSYSLDWAIPLRNARANRG